MWRYPKNEPEMNITFYQGQYTEGMTTELPDELTLQRWVITNFTGTEKDISDKVRVVKSQCPSGRLLDYGCSWGYGITQFCNAGFDAMGYEISLARARFGRERLGAKIVESRDALAELPDQGFDVIFANHVLEHLQDPRTAFEDWSRLVKPDGVVMVFVPNAGGEKASSLGTGWGPMIGEKHPLAIDAAFLYLNLPKHGLRPAFSASPFPKYTLEVAGDPYAPTLLGDELLAVAKPYGDQARNLSE